MENDRPIALMNTDNKLLANQIHPYIQKHRSPHARRIDFCESAFVRPIIQKLWWRLSAQEPWLSCHTTLAVHDLVCLTSYSFN